MYHFWIKLSHHLLEQNILNNHRFHFPKLSPDFMNKFQSMILMPNNSLFFHLYC